LAVLSFTLIVTIHASNSDWVWGRQGSGLRQPCQDRDAGQYCIGWNGILSCPQANVTLCPSGQWCAGQLMPGQWNVYNVCTDPGTVQTAVQSALLAVQTQWAATSTSTTAAVATGAGSSLASGGTNNNNGGSGLIGTTGTPTSGLVAHPTNVPVASASACPSYAPYNSTTGSCSCAGHGIWNSTNQCQCPLWSSWNGTTCKCPSHAGYSASTFSCKCSSKYAFGPNNTACHHKPSTCHINGTLGSVTSPCSDPAAGSAYYNASIWSYLTQPTCANGAVTHIKTCYLKSCNYTLTGNAIASCSSISDPASCNSTYQTIPIAAAVAPPVSFNLFRACGWNSTSNACATGSACQTI